MAEKPPSLFQTGQNQCIRCLASFGCQRSNERSFEDVAGTSFQATEPPDFWAIYKRETARYDEAFVGRHDRDLNVVIVTVRPLPFAPTTHLTQLLSRHFCIPSSVRSLLCRTLGPNPIRTANLQPCLLSTWATLVSSHQFRKLPSGTTSPSCSSSRVTCSACSLCSLQSW